MFSGIAAVALAVLSPRAIAAPVISFRDFRRDYPLPRGQAANGVAAADLNEDGVKDIVAATSSGVVVFLSSNGAANYGHRAEYPAGSNPVAIAVSDFNHDGHADVVTANAGGNDVTILFGAGDGTLGAPVHVSVGGSPSGLAVADINHDGKADIIVSDESRGEITVLLGNGDGTFQAPASFAAGSSPSVLCLRDFNKDGFLDVAVIASTGGAVTVLFGDGTGSFSNPQVSSSGAQSSISIAADDFNGDGFPDVAVAEGTPNGNGTGAVYVCFGRGDGTFQAPVKISLPQFSPVITSGDVNGDGHPDLMAAMINIGASSINSLGLLINRGSGTFSFQMDGTAENPGALAAVDLNGDGKLDVVVGCGPDVYSHQAYVSVLIGRGTSTLAEVHEIPLSGVQAVATGDFNGDGNPDVAAVGSSGVTIFLGNGKGSFTQQPSMAVATPYAVAVGDVNGDGKLDIVADVGGTNVAVFLGNGDGTFAAPKTYPGVLNLAFAVGDLNGDGYDDVLLGAALSNDVVVLWGTPSGALTKSTVIQTSFSPAIYTQAMVVADFNGDGIPDLAVSTFNGDNLEGCVELFPGQGGGRLGSEKITSLPISGPIVAGDLNGDGILDIVMTGVNANNITTFTSVLLGNGDGTFRSGVSVSSPYWTGSIAMADFNGDGNQDVVVLSLDQQLSVYAGDGTGNLTSLPVYGPIYGAGTGAWLSLAAADFLNNQRAGLVFSNLIAQTLSIVENDTP